MRGGIRKGAGGGDKTCEALSHQGLEKLLGAPSVDYSHTLPLFVLFISYLRSLHCNYTFIGLIPSSKVPLSPSPKPELQDCRDSVCPVHHWALTAEQALRIRVCMNE